MHLDYPVVLSALLFSLGIPGQAARAVACAVDKILHAGLCDSGPAYPVSVSTKSVGYDGRVIIVDAGHSYTVTLTHLSNGTAQISLVNTGTLGVSAPMVISRIMNRLPTSPGPTCFSAPERRPRLS